MMRPPLFTTSPRESLITLAVLAVIALVVWAFEKVKGKRDGDE